MIGFIYVLRCRDNVKIGWSNNPNSRLAIARNFNAEPVRMLAYYAAPKGEEAQLHKRFSKYRVGAGEWFRFREEIETWVDSLTNAEDDILTAWRKSHRGSSIRLAAKIGVTPGTISQWRRVPTQHLIAVEEFTGISRQELRPDIFGTSTPSIHGELQ